MENLHSTELSIITGGVTESPDGKGCTEPRVGTKDKQVSLPGNTLSPQITAL